MIIIDVGAYNGKPYLEQARKDKSIIVYAFEPNKGIVNSILKNKPDNYNIFPMVISEIDGTVTFYENKFPQTNSLLKFDPQKVPLWNCGDKLKTLKSVEVESIRLDTFINKNNIEEVDFLKIDAQGADLNVLKSCGDKLKIVKKLQVEVCDVKIYEGCNTFDGTISYLEENGFKKVKVVQYSQYKDVIFKNENC